MLCAEKKNQHKLLDQNPTIAEKIYRIDDHCAVGIAGITADANALISLLRANGMILLALEINFRRFNLHPQFYAFIGRFIPKELF